MTGVFMLLAALILIALVHAAAAMVRGEPHTETGGLVGEAFLLACILWYFNLLAIFTQLRVHSLAAYEQATQGKGFMEFCWSSRSLAALLYGALGELDLGKFPPSFQRRVRVMRWASGVLITAILLVVVGIPATLLAHQKGWL